MSKQWTQKETDQIKTMLDRPDEEIIAALDGYDVKQVKRSIQYQRGRAAARKEPPYTKKETIQLLIMQSWGMSSKAIGQALGRSTASVASMRHKMGTIMSKNPQFIDTLTEGLHPEQFAPWPDIPTDAFKDYKIKKGPAGVRVYKNGGAA